MAELINRNIVPAVPEHGGVGASGDLVQWAHIALSLIGEGTVFYGNELKDTTTVLKKNKLKPIEIHIREGLALMNGTSVMTALAALDGGVLDPKATVFCPGHYDLGDHRFHCWKHGGHGSVNFKQALAGSCDTFFYDVGKRTGIDKIQAMAKRFGLGQKTGIDLPHERTGLVPGRAWKKALRNSSWQLGETLIAAIGQGYMLTTPLQLAMITARIVNGGVAVVPKVGRQVGKDEVKISSGASLGIDPKHLDLVKEAMTAVVCEPIGTAHSARVLDESMAMGGKTGTAQVRRITTAERAQGVISNESLPWKERDHALFIGFAPVSDPRYAVAVVIEHGGSGAHLAAPIARDILVECQKRNVAGK
ncbi:MAG: aromatic amino acid lyase [Alphaproteobacteria bacterium]|nr:aromatic amino acid lyase [Alphaproteobacteria bacterium]